MEACCAPHAKLMHSSAPGQERESGFLWVLAAAAGFIQHPLPPFLPRRTLFNLILEVRILGRGCWQTEDKACIVLGALCKPGKSSPFMQQEVVSSALSWGQFDTHFCMDAVILGSINQPLCRQSTCLTVSGGTEFNYWIERGSFYTEINITILIWNQWASWINFLFMAFVLQMMLWSFMLMNWYTTKMRRSVLTKTLLDDRVHGYG